MQAATEAGARRAGWSPGAREAEPCPFCGSRRLDVRPLWGEFWFVACMRCRAAGPAARTVEGARDAWDRRGGEGWDPDATQGALF